MDGFYPKTAKDLSPESTPKPLPHADIFLMPVWGSGFADSHFTSEVSYP
jgi:hypothetical protein